MAHNPRRGVRITDLPLSLQMRPQQPGHWKYVILRNDGTPADGSLIPYETEGAAREAGEKAMRQRTEAAKPARKPR